MDNHYGINSGLKSMFHFKFNKDITLSMFKGRVNEDEKFFL